MSFCKHETFFTNDLSLHSAHRREQHPFRCEACAFVGGSQREMLAHFKAVHEQGDDAAELYTEEEPTQ